MQDWSYVGITIEEGSQLITRVLNSFFFFSFPHHWGLISGNVVKSVLSLHCHSFIILVPVSILPAHVPHFPSFSLVVVMAKIRRVSISGVLGK